ncbi:MAG TPA: hypothetical protein VMV92_07795, partial [Streptosporangiaceae bacterium]|nr:hypothetical protein [Streptosporangiaceae bacterium]
HLASLGVTEDPSGALRSAAGREVDAGTAVALLQKAVISPGEFQRPYLSEGHAAQSPSSWTAGIPDGLGGDRGRVARTGPAGPAGEPGSGTADRDMTGGEDEAAKAGLVPQRFHRPYLAAGHEADSPANTGRRGTTVVPETARAAEPQDYQRGWIQPGHQDEPPDDDPGGNNPHEPGTPTADVLATAAGRLGRNSARSRTDRLTPAAWNIAEPAPSRVALPQDMRASDVPVRVTLAATRPAPGETR